MASRPFLISGLTLAITLIPSARADKLQITSNPPGASVEIDGKTGMTPFEEDLPGGYFHDPHSLFSHHLSRPLVAHIALAGYVTREITLTLGPREWVSGSGHKRFQYYLLRAVHFHVDLDSVDDTFTGTVKAHESSEDVEEGSSRPARRETKSAASRPRPERTQEEVVQESKQAVVHLKGENKGGSGFFVTETGVIATNAHVVRDENIVFAELADGQRLEAKIVYMDPDLDIALAKVKGKHLPHLTLVEAVDVNQGESVIAIGSPGGAMSFSVTKGVVSAIGKFTAAGPGTWIQTDTAINPGSSGGPLVNSRGEAVGISTQKIVKEDVSGIGFALSATDLLVVLHRYYPKTDGRLKTLASDESGDDSPERSAEAGIGTVVFSQPEGAEIWIDHAFAGNIPSTLKISAGEHLVVVKVRGRADSIRNVRLTAGSLINLNPPTND